MRRTVTRLRQNGRMLDAKISQLVADYGVEVKAKLAGTGEPEEALRVPIEHLVTAIGEFGGKKTILDGPFTETKELIAGYWIWQVQSLDEAVEWARRCPDPMPGEESELEIRPCFETEDFGSEMTPELRAHEEKLRAELERQRQA